MRWCTRWQQRGRWIKTASKAREASSHCCVARQRDTHTPPHSSFSTAPATVPQQVSLTQSPCGCRGARVTGVGRLSARLSLTLWNRQRGRTAPAGRGALGRSPSGIASVNQRFFAYLPGRDRRQVKVTSGKSYCAPPAQWTPAPPYMLVAEDSTEPKAFLQQRWSLGAQSRGWCVCALVCVCV